MCSLVMKNILIVKCQWQDEIRFWRWHVHQLSFQSIGYDCKSEIRLLHCRQQTWSCAKDNWLVYTWTSLSLCFCGLRFPLTSNGHLSCRKNIVYHPVALTSTVILIWEVGYWHKSTPASNGLDPLHHDMSLALHSVLDHPDTGTHWAVCCSTWRTTLSSPQHIIKFQDFGLSSSHWFLACLSADLNRCGLVTTSPPHWLPSLCA